MRPYRSAETIGIDARNVSLMTFTADTYATNVSTYSQSIAKAYHQKIEHRILCSFFILSWSKFVFAEQFKNRGIEFFVSGFSSLSNCIICPIKFFVTGQGKEN